MSSAAIYPVLRPSVRPKQLSSLAHKVQPNVSTPASQRKGAAIVQVVSIGKVAGTISWECFDFIMGYDKLTLISASPSPFARMNRIALIEKGIAFDLVNEVPWNSNTQTPEYNPLEQLPILIFPDSEGKDPVYGSAHIQEYITSIWADHSPLLVTGHLEQDLKVKQIVHLSEGVLDASVLLFWESRREHQSSAWSDRQRRKINGGMKAFDALVKSKAPGSNYLVGGVFTNADIAVATAVTHIDFGKYHEDWQEIYPELRAYIDELEVKESFRSTRPYMFELEDDIV